MHAVPALPAPLAGMASLGRRDDGEFGALRAGTFGAGVAETSGLLYTGRIRRSSGALDVAGVRSS